MSRGIRSVLHSRLSKSLLSPSHQTEDGALQNFWHNSNPKSLQISEGIILKGLYAFVIGLMFFRIAKILPADFLNSITEKLSKGDREILSDFWKGKSLTNDPDFFAKRLCKEINQFIAESAIPENSDFHDLQEAITQYISSNNIQKAEYQDFKAEFKRLKYEIKKDKIEYSTDLESSKNDQKTPANKEDSEDSYEILKKAILVILTTAAWYLCNRKSMPPEYIAKKREISTLEKQNETFRKEQKDIMRLRKKINESLAHIKHKAAKGHVKKESEDISTLIEQPTDKLTEQLKALIPNTKEFKNFLHATKELKQTVNKIQAHTSEELISKQNEIANQMDEVQKTTLKACAKAFKNIETRKDFCRGEIEKKSSDLLRIGGDIYFDSKLDDILSDRNKILTTSTTTELAATYQAISWAEEVQSLRSLITKIEIIQDSEYYKRENTNASLTARTLNLKKRLEIDLKKKLALVTDSFKIKMKEKIQEQSQEVENRQKELDEKQGLEKLGKPRKILNASKKKLASLRKLQEKIDQAIYTQDESISSSQDKKDHLIQKSKHSQEEIYGDISSDEGSNTRIFEGGEQVSEFTTSRYSLDQSIKPGLQPNAAKQPPQTFTRQDQKKMSFWKQSKAAGGLAGKVNQIEKNMEANKLVPESMDVSAMGIFTSFVSGDEGML